MTSIDAGPISPEGTAAPVRLLVGDALDGQMRGFGLRARRAGSAVVLVPIGVLGDADSPRGAGIDQAHVELLAENVDQLPPILVHRPTMRVIDGMHRLHAARLARCDHIKATYFDGPESEAFLLAVQANIEHGLPLSLADRKESARRILHSFPHWSDRSIAARTGLSNKTVGALRREDPQAVAQAARVGRDGRVRPLDGAQGRLKAADVLSSSPQASLREIARMAGISVETARNVRERMAHQQSPLPAQEAPRPDDTACAADPRPALPQRQLDLDTALASLKKDPTLKYSSEGREMLRWLETQMIRRSEADLVMRAPTHQAPKIAAMARAFAEYWHEIAARLESQVTDASLAAE
ncbi:ParB N-terminal domain-containing protein [Streptomyces sp. NPDC005474]|uniref:ParB/RepB/Spo0J family partition protein n=1 Tax=Streptomyces sp. NPDC005474 TaxID=3154878 RepID=UPI003452841E